MCLGSTKCFSSGGIRKCAKRTARFVTENYNYEFGSMSSNLGHVKWESLNKKRKDNSLNLLYKGLKGKASLPTDDLIGREEITTQWHFRHLQLAQKIANAACFHRLLGIGMSSQNLLIPLLKLRMIVSLSK